MSMHTIVKVPYFVARKLVENFYTDKNIFYLDKQITFLNKLSEIIIGYNYRSG